MLELYLLSKEFNIELVATQYKIQIVLEMLYHLKGTGLKQL